MTLALILATVVAVVWHCFENIKNPIIIIKNWISYDKCEVHSFRKGWNRKDSLKLYAYYSEAAHREGYGTIKVTLVDGTITYAHFVGWSPDPKLFPDRKCLGLVKNITSGRYSPKTVYYGYYSKEAESSCGGVTYLNMKGEPTKLTMVSIDPNYAQEKEYLWKDTEFVGIVNEFVSSTIQV